MTLFSGIECTRKAWEMISAAALELWGINTGVRFTCAAAVLTLVYVALFFEGLISLCLDEGFKG